MQSQPVTQTLSTPAADPRVARVAPHRVTRRYVSVLAGVLLLWALPFTLNVLIDPLWYFAGNQLTPFNYPFNERLSKANLFQQALASDTTPDCLILGSSRTTLLDASRIEGRHCFNYAVSQASLADNLAIAKYVRALGVQPKTVIIALDGFLFSTNHAGTKLPMPPFYAQGAPPPGAIAAYLSVDALDFSYRTLTNDAPNDRYYDNAFVVHAIPGSGPFEPQPTLAPEQPTKDTAFNQFSLGPFRLDPIVAEIRTVFPKAEYIAYVPPVAAEYPARLALAQTLGSYLETQHAALSSVDALYDFSVPSVMTRNPQHTYDGSHFYKASNDQIAELLSAHISKGGINTTEYPEALALHTLSLTTYRNAFDAQVSQYLAKHGPRGPGTAGPSQDGPKAPSSATDN